MIYFIIYLFLEVLLSVNISSSLGGLATFAEIVLSAIFGISLLANFRKTIVENIKSVSLSSFNCIDLEQFQKLNLFTPVGAIFIIIPGFLTDFVGILMQVTFFTSILVNRYNVKSANCRESEHTNIKQKDSDVIDVEIVSNEYVTK